MDELTAHYNKFNEDKRLMRRHGQVEYITSMKYIHKYLEILQGENGYNITDSGYRCRNRTLCGGTGKRGL